MAEPESTGALTVSVVIPSIGRPVLAEVLERTLAQDPLEVVVVADRNPQDVDRLVRDAGLDRDPRLTVLPGPSRGVALARQAGVDAVTGDIVLLLDDDVVPLPALLEGHRRAHEERADLVVVGYMPVAPDLLAHHVVARVYSADYEAECAMLDADPTRVLYSLWAGNMSLRRSDCVRVPQAVDTFLASLLEDQEFGFRCLRAGLVGRFDRSLVATHRHDGSVPAFLRNARAQALAAKSVAHQYPDLVEDALPVPPLPRTARIVVAVASAPVVGGLVRSGVVRLATWLGRGEPTTVRVRTVVLARAVVQATV